MKQKLLFTLFTFLTFVLNLHAEIVIKESVIDIDNQQVKYVCENAVNNYRYTLDTYSWSERGPQFQILIEPIDNTQSAQFTTSDLSDENYWEPLFRRVTKQMVGNEMTAQNNIKKLYIYNVAMLENQFSDYEDMNYLDLEVTGNYTISNGLFSGCTRMRTFISNVSGTLTLGSNVVNAQPSFTVKVYTQEGANTWKAYKQNTGANFTVDESEVVTDQKIQGVTSTITFNNKVQTNPLPNRSGEISEGFTDPTTTLLFNGFTATATEDVTELFMDYCVIPANQSSQQYNWNHVYATNKGNGKWEYSGPAIDVLSGLQSNTTYRLEFSFNTNSFGDKEGRAHYPTNGETMSIEFTTSGSEPGPGPEPEPSVDVAINETTFPDANFRSWVLSQTYGADGKLTADEIAGVTSIDVLFKSIKSLQGIENFTALQTLECGLNQITSIDVSKNTALTSLNCISNKLTSLDVSKNTALTKLFCSSNQFSLLDVSKNRALTELSCGSEQLTSLDLSKNTALEKLTCSSSGITSLDVSKNMALTSLTCTNCQLTSLDVSKNTALTTLYCYNNQITSLNLSGLTTLQILCCDNNPLTSLDVSGCTALSYLLCDNNRLTSLDVSRNTALTGIYCYGNQLTSLDVSKNTALTELYCYSNQIKGAAMNALIESLPTVNNRTMRVIFNENEGNVMTTAQVAVAKTKGWQPLYLDASDKTWKEYEGSEPGPVGTKCATPTIGFTNGKLNFSCETENVEFVAKVTCTASGEGNYNVSSIPLTTTYVVSVYAKKNGYENSDVATKEIEIGGSGSTGVRGDLNGDGVVNMPDAMFIVNKILKDKFPDEE